MNSILVPLLLKGQKVFLANVIVKHLSQWCRRTYDVGIRKGLATNTSCADEQLLSTVTTSLPLASVLECDVQKALSSNGLVVHGADSPEHLHTRING